MPCASASPRAGPTRPPRASNDWMIPTTVPRSPSRGPRVRHRAQDPEIAFELDDFARGIIGQSLPNGRAGLAPGVDHQRENPGRGALVGLAELDRALAVEFASGQTLEEAIDEFTRNHPVAPQPRGIAPERIPV